MEKKIPSLPEKETVILDLLMGGSEMYGLEMVRSSSKLKRGSIYVTLARMEEKGLVASRKEQSDPHRSGIPRRLYRITGHGQRLFSAWAVAEAQVEMQEALT